MGGGGIAEEGIAESGNPEKTSRNAPTPGKGTRGKEILGKEILKIPEQEAPKTRGVIRGGEGIGGIEMIGIDARDRKRGRGSSSD